MVLSKKEFKAFQEKFKLSPRQAELAAYIIEGCDSNAELARRTGLTTGTVKVHLHSLFMRMGVGSKLCVATTAFQFVRSLNSPRKKT